MRKMGFVISRKNREKRRALLPEDLCRIKGRDYLYFERGYGEAVGYDDGAYLAQGVHVVSREEALACECICDMKLGDADYLDAIAPEKLLFGWAHAIQDVDFTTAVLDGRHTVLAWEEIYDHDRYVFYRNREVAGEAAILQAFLYIGKMPYESKVAVYGRGHTAKGALRVLHVPHMGTGETVQGPYGGVRYAGQLLHVGYLPSGSSHLPHRPPKAEAGRHDRGREL